MKAKMRVTALGYGTTRKMFLKTKLERTTH
jgi:hypothetical protein